VGDWDISAGFKNINENPRFSQLVSSGVDNAILIYEGKYGIDGTYRLIGPGAGSGPTTASMIKDANRLLQK
jgi:homoserine dehydrogenase